VNCEEFTLERGFFSQDFRINLRGVACVTCFATTLIADFGLLRLCSILNLDSFAFYFSPGSLFQQFSFSGSSNKFNARLYHETFFGASPTLPRICCRLSEHALDPHGCRSGHLRVRGPSSATSLHWGQSCLRFCSRCCHPTDRAHVIKSGAKFNFGHLCGKQRNCGKSLYGKAIDHAMQTPTLVRKAFDRAQDSLSHSLNRFKVYFRMSEIGFQRNDVTRDV